MGSKREFKQRRVGDDGPEFTISDEGGAWSETFRCASEPPASLAWAINRAIWLQDGERHVDLAAAISFMLGVLRTHTIEPDEEGKTRRVDADDRQRFADLVDDPDRLVTRDTIEDLTIWLIEEYGLRPTEASSRR